MPKSYIFHYLGWKDDFEKELVSQRVSPKMDVVSKHVAIWGAVEEAPSILKTFPFLVRARHPIFKEKVKVKA